jgi:hypothetical protein
LPKYHELVEDYDLDNNYDLSIQEWVDVNYRITYVYDDAHVNVLEETLPPQIKAKESKKIEGIQNI